MKEGQELAGITVAEGISARQKARQQRQEDIEKAKEMLQQTEEAVRVVEAGKQKKEEKPASEGGPGVKPEDPEGKSQEEEPDRSRQGFPVLRRITRFCRGSLRRKQESATSGEGFW